MNEVVLRSILDGVVVTAEVVTLAILVAAPLALTVALARVSRFKLVRGAALVYVEFLRGTSALVQLFWVYFVLPELGFAISAFVAGFVVLGVNASAYAAEVIRGAILAVPRPQLEAAGVLGLSTTTTMSRVVLPQAWPVMLPALGNVAIDVLKASALVSLITVSDFTREVTRWATTGVIDVTLAFSLLLVGYLLLSVPITWGGHLLEKRSRRHLSTFGEG
ncbi:amino acid ABC transporter permease [Nocardioides marmoriginsengisoli]|uniref:Amino acid ABC transporter permease n=1 Tax=Nocardioides marmoriginsengisoli TaxID=661483 RepID=A0A3N0CGF1_9ACTN|nr:amino acid ABC transporter permease [Nocardioides marmoriginsengisoli]RNL62517.1 amino acid ABC transporter permease [Nocardioides marmoriginsengisoli]